jgi:hypothetical protein
LTVQPFSDPISGGGILVQPEIRSPNFVPGVSGWIVRADGTAEFHGLLVTGGSVVVAGSGQGVFVYSGPPAPGNLTGSIASASGTDSHGNAYLAGITSQDNATAVVLNLLNGLLSIGTQAQVNAGRGAYVASAAAAGGILTLDSGKQTAPDQDCQVQIKSAAVSGTGLPETEILGQLLVDGSVTVGATGGGLLVVTEMGGAPPSQPVQFVAQAAGDRVAGIFVSGDVNARWSADSAGLQRWGSGAAFGDVTLFRPSAGVLQTNGSVIPAAGVSALAATPSGAPPAGAETWHSLGALLGYTVAEGRYKLTPENEVVFDIDVTANGVNSNTVAFANLLPAAYRPAVDRHLPLSSTRAVTAADPWPRLFVTAATGAVSVLQQANTTATLGTNVRLPLD